MGRVMLSGSWVPIDGVEDLVNRFFKRDRDGKFSSTGGGGIREALAGAATAEAVGAVAAQEAKRITGRDISFDFTGSDPQIAAGHAEGVLQGLERFPNASLQEVRMADLADGTFASCGDGTGSWGAAVISFSRQASADPQGYQQQLTEGSEVRRMGRQFVARDPTGVALHEFGHSVANGSGANIGVRSIASRWRQSQVDSRESDPEKAKALGHLAQAREVSLYSLDSLDELSAEAFSDVMSNGDGASGLSKEIFRHIERSARG